MVVLLVDADVQSLSVIESGEPLVPVPSNVAVVGDRPLVRAGLAARLSVAGLLLPPGRRLLVVEGHRSPADQTAIWDRYATEMAEAHPLSDAVELRRLTSRFVAPLELAPHVAGAAVDVTLVDRFGSELDLGTPIDTTPEASDGACYLNAAVSREARLERNALADAMTGAGLVNYPTEWWHWSYGDRYWAWATRATNAVYGPVGATSRLVDVAADRS